MPRVLVAITALTAFVLAVVVACLCQVPSGAGAVVLVATHDSSSSCQDDTKVAGEGMRFNVCADLDASRIDDLRGTWDPAMCVVTDAYGLGMEVPCDIAADPNYHPGDDTDAGA